MRAVFILLLAIGFMASLLSNLPSAPSERNSNILVDARAVDPKRIEEPEARHAPKFSSQDGSIELQRNGDGHFYADVRVNGAPIRMLVDTGASGIALSREDAQIAGLATSIAMNDVVGKGADGDVRGEYVRLERVELGPLSASGLDAVVLNGGEQSLLGQSFLRKFGNVQIEGDRMVLRQSAAL